MKYAYLILFLSFLNLGCELFTTRDPEVPDTPRSNFQVASTPEILINNLIDAFQDKNAENYMYCFVDSSFSEKKFSFQPSASAGSQYTFLKNWNLTDEKQYFINLTNSISGSSSIVLSLTDEEKSLFGDSLTYFATYGLNIPTSNDQLPKYYQGKLSFTIIRDSRSQWVISSWQDIQSGTNFSWSDLKGRYY